NAAGLEAVGDVDVLGKIQRRDLGTHSQIAFLTVGRKSYAARRTYVHTSVALDTFWGMEDRLNITVQAPLGFLVSGLGVESKLHFLSAVSKSHRLLGLRNNI